MYTKEEARNNIKKLAESFGEKLEFIKTSGQYKEAQIERDFIQPLFQYLNWNTSNEGISNPSEREFIVQAQGRKRKEPDYLLRLNNKPCFYIEAKHSKYYLGGRTEDKGKVKERTDYIWQAYSYSYSTQTRPSYEKVDFALLTDFEEFRFFDCTFAVKNSELINNYCVLDWTYKDYIENFDKLWEYFEKENVRSGSLKKLYINEKKIKENRVPPDKAFLKDLDDEKDGWRIKLAKDIKKFQPDLSAEFITGAVQLILDRFIFIKVLADREIEEDFIQTIVNKIQNSNDKEEGIVYEEFREIFEELDKTYNGSVFLKRLDLDSVQVSNKILIEILKDFLPENSRYNFKVIPVEILGTIYEQFLGKIVVTSDKRAKIDYKPEVRKAGGVYYTPDYIVNYIVENTVGKKLQECKKFDELLDIKICDPACGSGSFLIAAYDYLIKWTIKYYEKKIKNGSNGSELKGLTREERKLVYLDEKNNVRLTSKLKRDILISCIYGVDIDSQAVEVTKMSLSLKALEDTTHYEVHNERTLFHTTILPPLEGNIKCGNSLVDTDFYDSEFEFNFDKKIKPFNWKSNFTHFKEKKGFDIIIGNPPYIQLAMFDWFDENQKKYLLEHYCSSMGRLNTFGFFIERGIRILSEGGILGYIIPNTILTQEYYFQLREFILNSTRIEEIVSYEELPFKEAIVEVTTIILSKEKTKENIKISHLAKDMHYSYKQIEQKIFENNYKKQFSISNDVTLQKLKLKIDSSTTLTFKNVGEINQAIALKSDRSAFLYDKKLGKNYKPVLDGREINRYQINWSGKYLKYEISAIHSCKREDIFLSDEKVFFRRVSSTLIGTLDKEQFYALNTLVVINKFKELEIDVRFILGVFNSKLINYYYSKFLKSTKKVFSEIQARQIGQIPFPEILSKEDWKKHNEVVKNVELILELNKKNNSVKSENVKLQIAERINYSENKINEIVYSFYNLSQDEIKIIEDTK